MKHEPDTQGLIVESRDGRTRARPAGPPQAPRKFKVAAKASWIQKSLLFYGALLGAASAWSVWSGDTLLYAQSAAGGLSDARDIAVDAGIGVVAGLGVIRLSRELTRRTRWGEALADALADAIGRLSIGECIVLALASGIAEEAFFRGALQPQVGLFAASAIFGLAHLAPRRDLLPWTLFAAVMGLLMGVLFEWTGNLVAPVVAHVVINAVNLRRLALRWG